MTTQEAVRLLVSLNRAASKCDLSRHALAVLLVLSEKSGQLTGDVGRAVGISPAAMSRVVTELIEGKLIVSVPARDRRKLLLSLTKSGEQMAGKIIGEIGRV